MNKLYKKDILEKLALGNVWNKTSEVYGVSIATVMWDRLPWKVIHNNTTFDTVTHTIEVPMESKIFDLTYRKRTYTPIAEFRTQRELASYILDNLNVTEFLT